ncbi:hypothetical protein ED28_11665 [[Pantoea] beijingensis]|uniref:DUF937 domain-containing protein n=1 Tax=[Pantoea] beijingensis TaxID=1324864 RepID=A0A443IC49_9GAMM|nr:YidB family protein [[Pantoea] beijingensis]RWR01679.1 hypothetical protein ED28_11665 [[Pantoea] beijingensis]
MGLLDEIVGSLGDKPDGQSAGAGLVQLQAIWQWVQEQGGIQVLLEKFQQGGLGSVLGSWLGNGQNQAIGGHDVQSALGESDLQSLAGKLGTDKQSASDILAQLLPHLVDKASPQGEIDPQATQNSQLDLGSLVDGIFGKR